MQYVLDSSAVLALLLNEPGGEMVASAITESFLSTVNLTEVVTKLMDLGHVETELDDLLSALGCSFVDYNLGQSTSAALLRAHTRQFGLSLGDRACLALALQQQLPVLTADHAWLKLDVGVAVKMIR